MTVRAWACSAFAMKPREDRQKVMIKARMLDGASWHDICILNCSLHGLGIQSAKAPERGTYVEIRRGRQTIIARVAWSKGHRAGLRSQDPIFVSALVSGNENTPSPSGASLTERRAQPRAPVTMHSNSRLAGRTMEFAFLAVLAVSIALAGANAIGEALARPLSAVNQALV